MHSLGQAMRTPEQLPALEKTTVLTPGQAEPPRQTTVQPEWPCRTFTSILQLGGGGLDLPMLLTTGPHNSPRGKLPPF